MKHFFIYIFLLLLFIFFMAFYNTFIYSKRFNYNSEGFEQGQNQNINIILLGDSILKNNSYVSDGKGIDYLIKERNIGIVHSLAMNHSKIVDVYSQITRIPSDLNKETTYLFLSAGGNDILNNFVESEDQTEKQHILTTIFKAYKKLVRTIQTKLSNAKIILLDIYYPTNIKYTQHHPIIQKWNQMLSDFKSENHAIYSVLNISSLLTAPNDFTFDIEPSASGGKKIANEICGYIDVI